MKPGKLQRLIQRRDLVSHANDPKWGEFFGAIASLGLLARLKHVAWDADEVPNRWLLPTRGFVESSGTGPISFGEIEWFEISCIKEEHVGVLVSPKRHDLSPEVERAARDAHMTWRRFADGLRVYGYIPVGEQFADGDPPNQQ